MLQLDTTPALYEPEKAEEIATELNADPDDDWTYVVDHDPAGTGYSRIKIYEGAEFVAFWTTARKPLTVTEGR